MPNTRAFAFSAVLAAFASVAPAAFAQEPGAATAAPPPPPAPDATLDLTIPTGPAPAAEKPAPKPAAKAPAKKAPLKKPSSSRFSGVRGSLPPLSSRGSVGSAVRGAAPTVRDSAAAATQAPAMLGKLGVVRAASATLRADRTASGKPLSIVTKGANLAVVAEDGGHYGVLMVDNTVGWIPKSNVELIDFDVQITLPSAEPDGSVEQPAQQPAVESENGATLEGLDPRTESLLREAFSYLGVPYVWAGNTRRGIDCSGFVKAVFSKHGVTLPRHSGHQISVGSPVLNVEELQPGDRLYFAMKGGRIDHCGIYIGNGYFIHASSNQHKVGVDQLAKKNYWRGLVAARRDR